MKTKTKAALATYAVSEHELARLSAHAKRHGVSIKGMIRGCIAITLDAIDSGKLKLEGQN